jgi:hypothetical protein
MGVRRGRGSIPPRDDPYSPEYFSLAFLYGDTGQAPSILGWSGAIFIHTMSRVSEYSLFCVARGSNNEATSYYV